MNDKRSGKLDTVRLQNHSRAFIESATLFAAMDLQLFTCVSDGSNTIATFAEKAGLSATNAERLMTMCAAMELIEWQDDHFVNAPDVERFLVAGSASNAEAWLQFTRSSWKKWGELTDLLKNPQAPKVIGSYQDMTVEYARKYHAATSSVGFGSGRRFVKQVDLSHRSRMMDLGGGSGAYSIVAVQTYPGLSAVVLDLPPVAVITGEYIKQHKVSSNVSAVGGDFTTDPLPENCDVAVMASNLPQYSRDIIRTVIQKAHDTLLPGGEMHLIGEMIDDDLKGPVDAAIWGLYEVMANSTGITHSRKDCIGYFESAGFRQVAANDFIKGTLVRVSGVKVI